MSEFSEEIQEAIPQITSIKIHCNYTVEQIRQFVMSRSNWCSEDWKNDGIVIPKELDLSLFQFQSLIDTFPDKLLMDFAEFNGPILIEVGFIKKVGYDKMFFLLKDLGSVKVKIETFLKNHSMEDF